MDTETAILALLDLASRQDEDPEDIAAAMDAIIAQAAEGADADAETEA